MSVASGNLETNATVGGLPDTCRTPDGFFDEAYASPGAPRPHWAGLLDHLQTLGGEELAARWDDGRRLLRDHGVTYTARENPGEQERAWKLDLIPFLIDAAEWRRLEAGVIQRARLLNLILRDLYSGGQKLLRHGFLPPAAIFANPAFLRSCRGVRVPGDQYLHLHAVDLARSPEGFWWVLGERTQTPGGLGYTLENRTVISRVLPGAFRQFRVQRLSRFFTTLRESLERLAPAGATYPRVVMLAPGARSETFFEQALLARYLGLTLVEGADLTVRNRNVYLMTLEGLQKVDVILRRVDDFTCDPLELGGDSPWGVPGLLEVTRTGNVAVANALGAGLAESPALLPFLPGLCRQLLGEELQLPAASTWWCGQAAELNHVLDQLGSLVIKPAFPPLSKKAYGGAEMSAEQRAEMRRRITNRPHEFIGQSHIPLSHAPNWTRGRFESRPLVLRVYVAACGDSFAVLPGGLTRVSQSGTNPVFSLQGGGGSKDTWVLGTDDTSFPVEPPLSLDRRPAGRRPVSAPSRVADSLYWLGRYAERLEHLLRLTRTVLTRLNDEVEYGNLAELEALHRLFPALGLGEPSDAPFAVADIQARVLELLYEPEIAGGLVELLVRVRTIITTIRDRFSGDTWRILNRLRLYPGRRPARLPVTLAQTLVHDVIADLAAFSGMEMENMTRGHDWRFLDFGRRMERAGNLCALLGGGLGESGGGDALLDPFLEIADSTMTYRRRYYAQPELATVLELLLLDDSNPRALEFQVNTMLAHLARLPHDSIALDGHQESRALKDLKNRLRKPLVTQLSVWTQEEVADEVRSVFDGFGTVLQQVSESLTHRYFALTRPRVNAG